MVPFFTDGVKSFDEYMLVITLRQSRTKGHILGLMHNFKASVRPQPGFLSDPVMDYLPRTERVAYPIHVGAYDVDAIKGATTDVHSLRKKRAISALIDMKTDVEQYG